MAVTNIINRTDGVKVAGTSGADYISNSGERVTVQGGAGNDTIEASNFGEVFLFSSADDRNLITNFGVNDTIKITAGSIQTVRTVGENAIVSLKGTKYEGAVTLLGAGAYPFKQSGAYLVVNGINYIRNGDDGVKVAGTNGADYIANSGQYVSIQGGGGNDTVEGSEFGEVFLFSSADGRNVITNFGANDTLKITAGSIQNHYAIGSDYVVDVKGAKYEGSVVLKGAGVQKFKQSGSSLVVDGVKSIINRTDKKKVLGTSGVDFIMNSGENVSIQAGGGNDTIEGSDAYGEVFLFSSADGDNVITNFGVNDSIKITAGAINSTAIGGSDYIINLKGTNYKGSIRLLDAADYKFVRSSSGAMIAVDYVETISNDRDGEKITGSNRADYIINSGERVTIEGKGGNDTLTGSDAYGEVFLFSSADGNNLITNFGKNDTLRVTAGTIQSRQKVGNDYVLNLQGTKYAGAVTLAGAGALKFKQTGQVLTVDAVETLENSADGKKFIGTSAAEVMINYGERVTIESKGGNDTITGSDFYGEVFNFSSDAGDNVVTNFKTNDTLRCTAGSINSTAKSGSNYIINLKGTNYAGMVTLQGAANYKFKQSGSYLFVDDPITTVNGTSAAEVFSISSADGRKLIKNFATNDSLKVTGGSIQSTAISGSNYVINLKGTKYEGAVTLQGAANYKFKQSGSYLFVDDTPDEINYVSNADDDVLVSGSGGADHIYNRGWYVTINAGGGNDTIDDQNVDTRIDAGAGNDSISVLRSTVKGGTGNDTIVIRDGDDSNNVILFGASDGNDVLVGFDGNDRISLTSGSLASRAYSGSNYVVSIKSGSNVGSLTIKNIGFNPVRIVDTNGNVSVPNYTVVNTGFDSIVNGTSSADRIFNGGERVIINAGAGNDTVYTTRYDSMINGGAGNDLIRSYRYATIRGGAGNDTIYASGDGRYQFGSTDGSDVIVNFSNTDTLEITDGSIASHYQSGADHIINVRNGSSSSTINVRSVGSTPIEAILSNGAHTVVNYDILNFNSDSIINGTSSADRIFNGGRFRGTIAAGAGNDTVYSYGYGDSISGGAGDDSIGGDISGSTIRGGAGNDTVVGSRYGHNVYEFGAADGNDAIINYSGEIKLTSGSITSHYFDGTDYFIYVNSGSASGSITLKDLRDYYESFFFIKVIDVNDRLKVLNFDITNTASNTIISGTSKIDRIYNEGQHVTLNSNAGDDYICDWEYYGYNVINSGIGNDSIYVGNYDSINAGTGNDSVYADSYNTINAGAGDDTIFASVYNSVNGGAGNDYIDAFDYSTVRGGSGDDTIRNLGGKNLIQFGATDGNDLVQPVGLNDTLQITDGSIASHYFDGEDYVVRIGNGSSTGSITFANLPSYDTRYPTLKVPIHVIDAKGNASVIGYDFFNRSNNTKISGTSGADRIFDYGSRYATINAGAGDDTLINISDRDMDYASIDAGAGNDFIYGSFYYSTLRGGAGNDTISGARGYMNVYQFGASDDNDLIENFKAGDRLQLLGGSIASHYVDGEDYVVKVGSSATVTLKGSASIAINVILANGSNATLEDGVITSSQSNAQAEVPISIEDYWFDQTIENDPLDELETLLNRAALAPIVDVEFDRNEIEKMIGDDALKVSAVAFKEKSSGGATGGR